MTLDFEQKQHWKPIFDYSDSSFITESHYVIDTLHLCAEQISKRFMKESKDILYRSTQIEPSQQEVKEFADNVLNKEYYTGWCFTSLEDRLSALKNNNDYLPPFINIADESEAKCHPIYITYTYSEENFYMQAKLRDDSDIYEDCNPRMMEPMLEERATVNTFFELYQEINENESYKDIRKPEYIRKAYISDRMSNDKIIITINLNMFVEDDGHFSMYPDDILNFAAVMAHELQHIVEQYIFARHNCLSGIRNRITLDVNKENEFGKIKNQLYFKSACLLINLISPAEIRARLTQLDYYMKTLCKNVPEEFIDEIYSQYILCKYKNGSDVVDNLIETVFKNGNIRNITRFQSLRNIINNIKTYKIHQERELNNGSTMLYSLLIVLYYLVNHKFIEREKLADELSYILEYQNLYPILVSRKKIILSDEMIELLIRELDEICDDYQKKITEQISLYIDDIMDKFDQEQLQRMKQNSKMTYEEQLVLKRDYVRLLMECAGVDSDEIGFV